MLFFFIFYKDAEELYKPPSVEIEASIKYVFNGFLEEPKVKYNCVFERSDDADVEYKIQWMNGSHVFKRGNTFRNDIDEELDVTFVEDEGDGSLNDYILNSYVIKFSHILNFAPSLYGRSVSVNIFTCVV